MLPQLRELGVETIQVEYYGYGDSGGIEGLVTSPTTIERDFPTTLQESLHEACSAIAYDQHPGYEVNDGGSGNLEIRVTEGEVLLHHHDNYTESETTFDRKKKVSKELLEQLRAIKATEVVIEYSGYGDDGGIQSVKCMPKAADKKFSKELKNRIEDFVFDFIPGGWWNGAGGQGEATIDVETGICHAHLEENYTEAQHANTWSADLLAIRAQMTDEQNATEVVLSEEPLMKLPHAPSIYLDGD